jgi:hypothetical protein
VSFPVLLLDGLGQVDAVGVFAQRLHGGLVDLGDTDDRRLLQLEHGHVVVGQGLQGGSDVLELHRLVADFVDRTDVGAQDGAGLVGADLQLGRQLGDRGVGPEGPGEESHGLGRSL